MQRSSTFTLAVPPAKALAAITSASVLLMACGANPTSPELSQDLHAELEFAVTELATLTTIEVDVTVHSDEPGAFTDLSTISVEVRLEGETEWEATELAPHEDHFSAEMMFFSSGEYEARVTAQVTGSTDVLTLYQTTERLHVERIHQEVGDYIVEFETLPGHLLEGQIAEVTFWVLEASADAHAHGHAVGGLAPDIACTDANGMVEEHAAHEHEAGEYGAEHTLLEAGTAHFELHFTDAMGVDRHAEFSAPVSHEH